MKYLLKQSGILLISLFIISCATPKPGPALAELPVLDPGSSGTLKLQSKFNPSPIKHHHIVILDGQKIAVMEESDSTQFQLTPEPHKLELTCHTRNTSISGGFPVNYNVADGSDEMEINIPAGEQLCIKVAFKLLECAVLEEADPSFCE